MTRFATSLSIGPPKNIMRSLRRREKMSYARSPKELFSTTIGTSICERGKFSVFIYDYDSNFLSRINPLLTQATPRISILLRPPAPDHREGGQVAPLQ